MKKTAIIPVIVGLLCFGANSAFAQFNNFGDVIRAGVDDAETLTRAYLAPLPSGFGSGINSGWVNTAKTHQPLGFDIQIRTALSFVPATDETFDFNNLDLQKTYLSKQAETSISPTIGGNNQLGPEVVVKSDNGDELARFYLPKGSGYPVVPSAMIQASVGLVADTDLIIRYIPEFSYEDTKFNMYGFGLKHSINQWIPGGKMLPVNISIMGGFTRIDVQSALNLQPQGAPATPEDAGKSFDEQFANISLNAFTVKALVGKSLPFISIYGGVGYQTSTMEVDVEGNYPVNVSPFAGIPRYKVISDPFSYDDKGSNKFSLLGGATLKMAFFRLFGEFTLAEYSTASVGIGFNFR